MPIPQVGVGDKNVEVQRWQHFLWKLHAKYRPVLGAVDGQFGGQTSAATRMFQADNGLPLTGSVDAATLAAARTGGYRVVASNFYDTRSGVSYPPRPAALRSPSDAWRWQTFGGYPFRATTKLDGRIVIAGSWVADNIVEVPTPQLAHLSVARIAFHRRGAAALRALLQAWEAAGLMHLVLTYEGSFVPRYKRWETPSTENERRNPDRLSNHAIGTAFDINLTWNPLKVTPAVLPKIGSVRELVEIANANGFYWGGHFTSPKDGMHFELAKL